MYSTCILPTTWNSWSRRGRRRPLAEGAVPVSRSACTNRSCGIWDGPEAACVPRGTPVPLRSVRLAWSHRCAWTRRNTSWRWTSTPRRLGLGSSVRCPLYCHRTDMEIPTRSGMQRGVSWKYDTVTHCLIFTVLLWSLNHVRMETKVPKWIGFPSSFSTPVVR